MTTLQRSSVSFRRQGSSGRIWDDRLQHLHEPKSGELNAALAIAKSQEDKEFANPQSSVSTRPSGSEKKVDLSPSPKSERKAQKCAFSAIFRRCAGSPA